MKYLSLIFLFVIAGCDILLDDVVDCLDGDGPEISWSPLPAATLNELYYLEILASIKNEPRDSLYDYEFDIEGALPPGLNYYTSPSDDRLLVIRGTPVLRGEFVFDLSVRVSLSYNSYNQDDNLCYHTDSETFSILVQMDAPQDELISEAQN